MFATPTPVQHPTPQQLRDFAAGRSDSRLSHWIEGHLPNCPECLGHVSAACDEPLIDLLRDDASSPVPPPDGLPAEALPHALRDHPRYRVVRRLGDGGMGVVWLAEHRLLDRPVVLKVIRPGLVQTPELQRRFLREARLAAKLQHPNVVGVYEAEQVGPTALLVMEYVAGETFARLVRRHGPMPVGPAAELARRAALGLQHVHERGLVHRDVKPSNLILTPDGQVKVLDLGLAFLNLADDDSVRELTQPEQNIGTVDFTAPEQWEDCHGVDTRADVYGLGCTLFFLLTGVAPYARGDGRRMTLVRQLWAHSTAPVPDVCRRRDDVPAALGDVVRRMLAKAPDDRFPTPGDAAAALAPLAAGDGLTAYLADERPNAIVVRPAEVAPAGASPVEAVFRPGAGRGPEAATRPPAAPSANSAPVRSRRTLLLGTTALAITAGGTALFRRYADDTSKATAAAAIVPAGEPIRVGVLHSLSGTMAISERPVVDATLLAINELNADGGVLGRPVEAVVADGASEGPLFARAAEKLITRERVVTVFGCWTSASRRTVRPVFEKHGHLLFYPVQYEGLEQSPNIVYTGAAPNQQILPAVRWCTTVLNKRRLFLVGSDYVFPRCANAIIHDCVSTLGAEIVGEAYLPLGSQDASDVIRRIRAAKPDIILNTINGDSNVAFYRALRPLRETPNELPVMSFSIAEEELRSLSAADVSGDYAAWNYFMSIDRDTNRRFVRRFQDRYGSHRVLTDPMEAAYFGVHLWAKAVAQAGSADVSQIHRHLAGQAMDAPEGEVTLDPLTQHTRKVVRIGKIVEASAFEVIYTSENPINPEPYPATRTPAQWQSLLDELHRSWGGNWARQTA